MNVFLLPPERHFDGGLGATAGEFKRSAEELKVLWRICRFAIYSVIQLNST
ncbi:hypothetical protein VCR31J2_1370072 [Vibrio coralliirubri]|uniref:Uncharacterized protein n=1 Tax=Vibrio coralliirubri TaxID=1516159 RepID=A0AA87C158_9VIBR|nr:MULTISPECIES: hypothetical protein [Vibrio]CDT86950.1 hypothetical protein VCR31J2_1370072 [Vibrio coralliirubri]